MTKYLITVFFITVFCFEFAIYAEESVRFSKGINNLEILSGKGAGDSLMKAFGSVSPDLGKIIVEYGFGDIYDRKGLDFKTKEIAIIANIIAGGSPVPQVKSHINAALNLGCSVTEIKEVIIQLTAIAGFPKANNAIFIFKDILKNRAEKGIIDNIGAIDQSDKAIEESRYKRGVEEYEKLNPGSSTQLLNSFKYISPDLSKYILEFGYGDIHSRSGLSQKDKAIVAISALTAIGTARSQLEFQ